MKSFGLWYKKKPNFERAPKFSVHVNFWSESTKKDNKVPDLDVGIKVTNYEAVSKIVFHCPFKIIKSDIKDLEYKLRDKKNANLIFNTDGEIETSDAYSIFKYGKTDSEEMVLFPLISSLGCAYDIVSRDAGKTDIVINLEKFEQYICDKLKLSEIKELYIRFRITTIELNDSIYFDSEPVNKSFESAFSGTRIIDFKINSKRNLSEDTITDIDFNKYEMPMISKFHLLVMEPSSFDLESFSEQQMTCRELERNLWDDYFESSIDFSQGHILAYHWKYENVDSASCLVKVKYSRTKKTAIAGYVVIVIALGMLGSTIVSGTQELMTSCPKLFIGVDLVIAIVLFLLGLLLGRK